MITEDPVKNKLLANKMIWNTSSISAKEENKNGVISQIITGIQNASRHESVLTGGVICFPPNGNRTLVYAGNRIIDYGIRNEPAELGVDTYNHLGSRV